MALQIKEPMNALPVATYRWLRLNHLILNENIEIEVKPYSKVNLSPIHDRNIYIKNMDGTCTKMSKDITKFVSKNLISDDNLSYGVSDELVELNENSFNSGVYIHVPQGVKASEPVVINYKLDVDNDVVMDNNLIVAEKNSSVTVILDYSSDESVTAFHNGTLKVYAAEGSQVTIVKVQRMNDLSYHFDSNVAYVSRGARVSYIQAELGSSKSVTNYINHLDDEGEANIDSMYLGDGERLIDLSYQMLHKGRRSISNILTKGALKDRAKKVFRGTIDFKKGATRSTGSEEEFVILFDKGVRSEAVPLLLCGEDDVKGQHAASAGKVDSEKLFYMMSRGFSREEAMKMIVEASFQPILDKIPSADLRKVIGEEIHRRLVNG